MKIEVFKSYCTVEINVLYLRLEREKKKENRSVMTNSTERYYEVNRPLTHSFPCNE